MITQPFEQQPNNQSHLEAIGDGDLQIEIDELQAQLEQILSGRKVSELSGKELEQTLDLMKRIEELQNKIKIEKDEKEKYWTRERFVEWASDEICADDPEKWVEENINLDEAEAPKVIPAGLKLRLDNIKRFPPGLVINELILTGKVAHQNLVLPKIIIGNLEMNGLTDHNGLVLPDHVGGVLGLNSLPSFKGLKLPSTIGGPLWLNGLITTEGLELSGRIGGKIFLGSLVMSDEEKDEFKKNNPEYAKQIM